MKTVKFIGLALWLGMMSLFVYLGFLSLLKDSSYFKGFEKATGMVVAVKSISKIQGKGACYYPVVEFMDARHNKIQFMDDFGSYPSKYSISDQVSIFYNPVNPMQASIDDIGKIIFSLCFIIGGILLAIWISYLFLKK